MATAREANELKQQGAVEAAENPQSQVTADDAQREIVESSRNAGVTAFTFDPDASPEQKRAQARKVRNKNENKFIGVLSGGFLTNDPCLFFT